MRRKIIPWTRKPPVGCAINWNRQRASGLIGLFLLNEGAGTPLNLVTGQPVVAVSTAPWVTTVAGTGMGNGTGWSLELLSSANGLPTIQGSYSLVCQAITTNPTAASGQCVIDIIQFSTSATQIEIQSSGVAFAQNYGGGTFITGSAVAANTPTTFGISLNAGAASLYQNGILQGTGTQSQTGTPDAIYFSTYNGGSEPIVGYGIWAAIYNRPISAAEQLEWAVDPWGVILPMVTRRAYSVGGGGFTWQQLTQTPEIIRPASEAIPY